MKTGRILIISNGALCRNPRLLKEATCLGTAGHHVTVLTVRNHVASEVQDAVILATAPFSRITIDTISGVQAGRLRPFLRRLQMWALRKIANVLAFETAESLGPAAALLSRARRFQADLVIVHNEVAHWVGARLLAEGRRVAADIEDWHSEDLLPNARAGRPIGLLKHTEQQLLRHAAYTTTTSESLAQALHAAYGGNRPTVITNSFPLQPDPHQGRTSPPAFFWFSQTIGPGRGLEEFILAWQQTKKPSRLVILGEPQDGYTDKLLSIVPPERRPRISFLPLVAPADLPAVIARHDIGLALEQSAIVNRDLTITNKILQYLDAGLAVVATSTAGQREVLARSPEAGLFLSNQDISGNVVLLDTLLADPGALVQRQSAARRLAENVYCWELEAPRLLELVEGALA